MIKNRLFLLLFALVALRGYAQNEDLHFRLLHDFMKTDYRKEIRIPGIMGLETLKCDLHMHTIFSDGNVLPQERVTEAWREGLDVIAITDHDFSMAGYITADYNTGWELARPVAERFDILLIKGIEFTRNKPVGHFNFLFIDDANIYVEPSVTPHEAIEMAAAEGAFVMYNHPGWPDRNSDLFEFQLHFINEGKIHGMEVFNGNEFYPLVIDYCNSYDLAFLSTTDIHAPIHARFDVDNKLRNMTLVFAEDRTMESVKEALFAGRTLALADNFLAGKPEYMLELIRESLVVTDLNLTDENFSCKITNISDITYMFERAGHRSLVFPAGRTIRLSDRLFNADIVYDVTNTFISSGDHLSVPLYFLIADKNEIGIPFVNQELKMIEPRTPIEFSCMTPGVEIRYTLDGSEPVSESILYTGPFTINRSSIISARAFREGMKPGRVFRSQAILNTLHEGVRLSSPENGVNFSYYEGRFSYVRDIEANGEFIREGVIDITDISIADVEDYFGIIFSGYIYAPVDGLYLFAVESDDGSTFSISGVELIDNDGSHGTRRVTGQIKLKRGYHPFELPYFQDYAGKELNFLWAIPGRSEEPVDKKFLFIKK